jgi:membrane dipeptidase
MYFLENKLIIAGALTAVFFFAAVSTITGTEVIMNYSDVFTHDDIARDSVIIDLHSDAPNVVYRKAGGDVSAYDDNRTEACIPCLQDAGIKAQFYVIWDNKENHFEAADIMLGQFNEMLGIYADDIAFAGNVAEMERNISEGKISAFLALEGGDALGKDIDKVDYFYDQGVRYMTLVWNYPNALSDCAKHKDKPHGGLSDFGRKVVKRMNKLGMMVDVSHASDDAVRDVLAVSMSPVIASHSNAWAVKRHPRNLKDDLIFGICNSGGMVGVNYHQTFLTYQKPARIKHVADHIDHLVEVGGVDCIALGSDFDGGIFPPRKLENAGKLPNLTKELVKRGYSKQDLEKIYGKNAIRVMKKVLDEKHGS